MNNLAGRIFNTYVERFPNDPGYVASKKSDLEGLDYWSLILKIFDIDDAGQRLLAQSIDVSFEDFQAFTRVVKAIYND